MTARIALFTALFPALAAVCGPAGAAEPDLLGVVRAYADGLLEHGRDVHGEAASPLFATTLGRADYELGQCEPIPGIREHDRMPTGANPMHDQNLYQVLYALTVVTGEERYAKEADRALAWFFEHCQSPATGLMAWGEHIGWDFNTETLIDKGAGTTHEYFRPWVLWPRSFVLAPDACEGFARGVWEHQIADHGTGNFSRHANYAKHGPGTNSEYPRHGGFYIATWAMAYERTQDPVFLTAIETLVDYFNGRRSPQSDAIPAESNKRSEGLIVWTLSNVSLAVDLEDSAWRVPPDLGNKLRATAARTDKVFLRINHDLSPGGTGFVTTAHTHTLDQGDVRYNKIAHSRLWATGYGQATDAAAANLCMLRYRQTGLDGYRKLILDAAERYMASEIDTSVPVYPGTMGDVMYLMLAAHEITGNARYLERADRFAAQAVDLFLTDGSPLPKASTAQPQYEAITRGDTMMMALLKLWAVRNRPGLELALVYNDR